MRNVWIIAHREYIERIRTRGFLITTVMIPLVIAGFAFGSTFLAARANTNLHIAVVSNDPQLAGELRDELERQQAQSSGSTEKTSTPAAMASKPMKITVDGVLPSLKTKQSLEHDLDAGRLDGYLWVSGENARQAYSFTPRRSNMRAVEGALASALERLEAERIARQPQIDLFAAAPDAGAAPDPAGVANSALEDAVAALDPDILSPREALEALYRLKALHPERS